MQQLVNLKLTPFDALYQKSTNYNHSHTGNVTNIEQGFGGTSFVDDLYDEITQNRVANTFLATTLDHEYNLTTAVQQHLPSITVANQGVLKINANQGAGLGNGPTPVAGSLYEISTGQCNPVDVEVLSGGIIEVGETSPNNKVHVIFQEGSSLTIENGGQLVIHENSVVTIETGASYTVNDLRNVVIKPGGVLKVEGMFYFDDSNPFNITGGGTLHLKPENVTVLDLNQLNNFAIDNSTLILDENTELSYHIGNKLTLNSGILEIRNQLTIAPNATFTFGSDAGQALGMLRLSPYDSENFMVAGSGSEFVLPISTSGNPVLDIQANTRLYSNYQTGAYFDRAVFDDSHINIAPGKYLQTGAPVLRMNHTTVTGGGTLAVFRPIASATDGGNFHQITNCVIDGSVLSNAPSFLQQKEAVTVTRSQFINKALLFDSNSKGIHVTSCAFTENSSFLCYRGLNSEIVNCTFDGELIDNTSAIRLSSSFSPVKIKDNTIEHYKKGVNATSRSQYGMACNIVVDNEIGLNHGSFSEALMAGANQGYNYITNNTLSNLMVNYGQIIDFNGGGNAFFNDQTTGGNRYIFGGICYTQAKVYCGTTQYYDCTNNQWSEENPLAQPSSLGGKFNLRILDPITCDVCPFIVRDLLPKELIACPYRGVIGSDKPNIPGLTGLSNIDHIVGDAHVDFCTSCPPIQTEHFKGTPLTQAINEAALLGSFNDGEDDVKSLELYRQILTYNYPDRNEEVYAWLKKAYIYAKAAASALLANNIQAEVEPRIQDIHRVYDPALFEGNTDIDKLFYQADKADFERYFGRIENAWSQLAALAAQTTGKIQALMNQRLATVSAEIQYLAGEIPWDDFMDTIQNLVGTGGGTIGVGPDGSGCDFVINKTADPNRQQTFANAGQTTTALMPAGATTWKMSNAALEQVFAINPNPAKEKVLVTVAINNRAKQLRLVDISGKQMMAPLMLENELTEFSVSEIPVGIYFVQLFENEVLVKTEKLLIIK